MAGGGEVTCVYTNNQQLGAIKITKTRKHAASGSGDQPHAGVNFTVNGVTKATDANGVACFDGLAFGTYSVTETVPAGYSVDLNPKSATVDNNAQCSDDPYVGESVTFHNTPLTDVTVSVDSQIVGGTSSTIECTDADGNEYSAGTTNGDGSLNVPDLLPTDPTVTLTCEVTIDP
jgi:uncharacterized surface anchored protein